MTDKFAGLDKITRATRAKLYDKNGHPRLLAELKYADRKRYEKLIETYRGNNVPKVYELEREVTSYLSAKKKAQKQRAADAATAKDGFARDDNGHIKTTQDNIRLAVKTLGVKLSYDAFAGTPVIEGLPDFGPAMDDAALDRLWLRIDAELDFRPAQDIYRRVIADTCRQNSFHPVRDYLDGLQWDGKLRLDSWLIDFCKAEDTPFNRAVGALVLIAAVRRVRQPGCKFDTILVLESPEGFRKSMMLAALAVNEKWFTDSVPLAASDKIMIELSRGKWVAEIAELTGRHGDVDKIKAQASRQSDRARMAYAELAIEVLRQFIFIGTTNNEKYLASLTGNRRFWPCKVGVIDIAALRKARDQLWAEASKREAEGASLILDEKLWPVAATAQKKRELINPFIDALGSKLGGKHGSVSVADLLTILNIPVERRNGHIYELLYRAMAELGFEKAKADGLNAFAKGATEKEKRTRLLISEHENYFYDSKRPWDELEMIPDDTDEMELIPGGDD